MRWRAMLAGWFAFICLVVVRCQVNPLPAGQPDASNGDAGVDAFSANPEVEKMGDLYTVDMLVHYVQSKLSA